MDRRCAADFDGGASVKNVTIAESLWRHLNEWPEKPAPIGLDNLEKQALSIMLRQLPGAAFHRRYIDGSCIGTWPFAVTVRVQTMETARRLDAARILYALHAWLSHGPTPDLGPGRCCLNMEMTLLPSVVADYNNCIVDYQAQYAMRYSAEALL